MLDQWKQRLRQHQHQKLCQKLQLSPQLVQDLPALANQNQQSNIAVTRLERAADAQGSSNVNLNMLMKTTYSQSGEDAILAYLFAVLGIPFAKCSYLDLGANRPKEMSNTYFFYEQGATGTLIEANPALIPALQKERSGDTILNRCIAPRWFIDTGGCHRPARRQSRPAITGNRQCGNDFCQRSACTNASSAASGEY